MPSEPPPTERTVTLRQALTEATALFQAGRLEETESLCRQLLDARPQTAGALQLLGLVEHRRGNHEPAADLLRQALALRPEYAEDHSNLAVVLESLGRHDEALTHYRRAIALKPDYPEAYSNLGIALGNKGDLDGAVSAYRQALVLKPSYAEAHYNLGHALQDLNRPHEALAAYRKALALRPAYPDALWGMGWILLLTGAFAEGWRVYEQRFTTSMGKRLGGERGFGRPRWKGEPLAGRTLLIHSEQGLGDTIQFCRYLPLLDVNDGDVIFEVQPALSRLLRGLPGVRRMVPRPKGLSTPPECSFDVYVPLLSLPYLRGATLETIPAEVPYLRPEPGLVRDWRTVLSGPGLRVGLVWAGNPSNPNDHNRSCPLSCFAPLAAIPGVRFFSLQKGDAAAQTAAAPSGLQLIDLRSRLTDFADTAAVLAQLDLVIAVDTAVAHLAGALGRPAWTLLPFAPDWRWLLVREDTPWYPTMRLFRQERLGDWSAVVARVAEKLRVWVRGREGPPPEVLPPSLADGLVVGARVGRQSGPGPDELLRAGIAAWQAGERTDGLRLFRRAAAAGPEQAETHYNLGVALQAEGKPDEAADAYLRSLALRPDAPEVHYNLANALRQLDRLAQAVVHYRRALALRPGYRKALTNLGGVLLQLGQLEAACAAYQKVLEFEPDSASAHRNLGTAWQRHGHYAEAVACFRKALEHGPAAPEDHVRLGLSLEELGAAEEGLEHIDRALRIQPEYAEALHARAAVLLRRQGPTDEVLAQLRRAVALEPERADTHVSLALALLTRGDFEQGFAEYEWRWRLPNQSPLRFQEPAWDGGPCGGRTLLLWAEQGLGDTIQFARYAALLAERGARVLLACPTPLVRLLNTVPGVALASDRLEDLAPFDGHVPLLSLPWFLGTTKSSIPVAVPYMRPPDDEGVCLKAPPKARLRVGLCWSGNPLHRDDHRRSCPAELFRALLAVPGVAFWSLQPGPGAAELDPSGQHVQDLGAQLRDFAHTAAVIEQLDLVISVDTAVAHLTGALGKPGWLLLPFAPDWRWGRDGTESTWYPSLRLLRQSQAGDWESVLARAAKMLGSEAAKGAGAQGQFRSSDG